MTINNTVIEELSSALLNAIYHLQSLGVTPVWTDDLLSNYPSIGPHIEAAQERYIEFFAKMEPIKI